MRTKEYVQELACVQTSGVHLCFIAVFCSGQALTPSMPQPINFPDWKVLTKALKRNIFGP